MYKPLIEITQVAGGQLQTIFRNTQFDRPMDTVIIGTALGSATRVMALAMLAANQDKTTPVEEVVNCIRDVYVRDLEMGSHGETAKPIDSTDG